MLDIGSLVLFEGKEYIILYVYPNGYCEVKEFDKDNNSFYGKVELVEASKLVRIS